MLELAGTLADGAHPYFVPPEHTARAREILGPDPLLAPEVFAVLKTDPAEARRIARENIGFYLGAPNYVNNLIWLGYGEDDIANGGSDALVDSIIAWGDEGAIRARVQEHFDAGADHVCVQPLGRRPGDLGLDQSRLEEIDRPRSADDDVLIRVRATSVNTPDWITVTGSPLHPSAAASGSVGRRHRCGEPISPGSSRR